MIRIVGCGLLAVAALLGPAPAAVASELTDADTAAPQTGVSMLALSLTAGGAVAAVGSGVALALARRRDGSQHEVNPASRRSG